MKFGQLLWHDASISLLKWNANSEVIWKKLVSKNIKINNIGQECVKVPKGSIAKKNLFSGSVFHKGLRH